MRVIFQHGVVPAVIRQQAGGPNIAEVDIITPCADDHGVNLARDCPPGGMSAFLSWSIWKGCSHKVVRIGKVRGVVSIIGNISR